MNPASEHLTGRLADLRRDYTRGGLDESQLTADPYGLFGRWLDDARAAAAVDPGSMPEPNAVVVATAPADAGATPSARFVLLKDVAGPDDPGRPEGFVFYTGYGSRKGGELMVNPACSLLFGWLPLERQVRVEGVAERVTREETQAYFDTRPRDSRLGAWASEQSSPVPDRAALEAAFAAAQERFDGTDDIPAPPRWGGYRVVPRVVEFWQGRHGRLHDRLRYLRTAPGEPWTTGRLAP